MKDASVLGVLARTSSSMGHAPRSIEATATVDHSPRPSWLRPTDALWRAEADRALLLREGRVVKSWLVMANESAFLRGSAAHPALVIYALSDEIPAETLEEAARAIPPLLRTKPVDADLAALARELTAQPARPMGLRVPHAIALGHTLWLGTILVHRSHLPRPYLAAPLLPILVHEKNPSIVLLPAPWWADDLRAAWIDLAAEP